MNSSWAVPTNLLREGFMFALALCLICSARADGARLQQADKAYKSGDYLTSAALLEAEVAELPSTLGERHAVTLLAMSNLANVYARLGRLAEAQALNERVLKVRTEIRGERDPDTLNSFAGLAVIYGAMGRTADQLALNEKLLKLRVEVLGEKHPDTIEAMSNLASNYGALGRTAQQLALNERAVRLSSEVLGERHPATLISMNNLAGTYSRLGRRVEALSMGEKLLGIRVEVLGERHPETLASMSSVALGYASLGRNAEGLELSEKVLRLRTEILGERHPHTLNTMGIVAENYRAMRRYADWLALNERVMKLRVEVQGEGHPDTLNSTWNLVHSYLALGRLADVAALSTPFVRGAEWQRAQPGLAAELRQTVFEPYAQRYRLFSAVHGSLGQAGEGWRLSELGKGRTLLEGMAAQRSGRSGVLPHVDQASLDDLSRQVATQNQIIATASDAQIREKANALRNDLARRYDALSSRLKTQYPKYRQLVDAYIVGAGDLPGLIPSDALAVSYVVNAEEVYAWLVDSAGKPRFVNLGKVLNLTDAVEAFRLASRYPGSLSELRAVEGRVAWRLSNGSFALLNAGESPPKGAVEVREVGEIAAFLSRWLLQPLSKDLQDKSRLIVSPDGALAQLPFELLSLGGESVLAKWQLHYTQSLSAYALSRAMQREYGKLNRRLDLLAVGNPDYQPSADLERSRMVRLNGLAMTREVQLGDTRGLWESLPGTEEEVKALRQIFPNNHAFLKADASEAKLQELNARGSLKDYRYLHFATHGFLSTAAPALSSVVLSQVDVKDGTDGFITAAEWPAYDLRSDLTVLSACETGLGRSVTGEGVMGLPFGLFVAGSVNTILSLWPVDDDATALFMRTLYGNLKRGQSAAQALTETKREFVRHPRYSAPSFWAAFVLVGGG